MSVAEGERVSTVLLVDDEPNVLSALQRTLHGQPYAVAAAACAGDALSYMAQSPADVIVSDLNMPGMGGAALLARIRERWPDAVRIVLTGEADLRTTVTAVNRGEVYRYILKPWDGDELRGTIAQAVERARLVRERDALLARTVYQAQELRAANATLEERVRARTIELSEAHASLQEANERLRAGFFSSLRIFGTLVELRGGKLAGHGRRVANLARRLGSDLGLDERACQDVFVAALLHDIGKIGLPDNVLNTPVEGLGGEQLKLYRSHPLRGEHALMSVEELRGAARLIRSHHERQDGQGFPDGLRGEEIPLGARILAVLNDYDGLLSGRLHHRALDARQAMENLERGRGRRYDAHVVERFRAALQGESRRRATDVPCSSTTVRAGDVVARDLITQDGRLLLAAGHVLTEHMIEFLREYEAREHVKLLVHIGSRTAESA